MRQKKAVTRELRKRYQKARKKEKTVILDEFTQLTGYNRCYACQVLNVKKVLGYLNIAGKRIKYIADKRKIKRKKKKIYDQDVLMALKEIWKICDYICSKRLAPFLSEIIPILERWGEIKLNLKVREKLFKISAATIDRLLSDTRNLLLLPIVLWPHGSGDHRLEALFLSLPPDKRKEQKENTLSCFEID